MKQRRDPKIIPLRDGKPGQAPRYIVKPAKGPTSVSLSDIRRVVREVQGQAGTSARER